MIEFLLTMAAITAVVLFAAARVAYDAACDWWLRDQPQYVNLNDKRLVELIDLERRQEHER